MPRSNFLHGWEKITPCWHTRHTFFSAGLAFRRGCFMTGVDRRFLFQNALLMNLPNQLTVSRLVLTVVFVAATAVPWAYGFTVGLVLFSIASITDWLDGKIARERNLVTAFGQLMDPLADKVLMAAAFVTLMGQDLAPQVKLMPGWLLIAILSREFLVTGLRLVAGARGAVLAADRLGKQKTIWQIVTACYLLLYLATREAPAAFARPLFDHPAAGFSIIHPLLLGLTLVTTVYSGLAYFWKNRQIVLDQM
jgi:CDP-diacylglycerol--glycerol-3-phosphate 3-phosphatidyltransferase